MLRCRNEGWTQALCNWEQGAKENSWPVRKEVICGWRKLHKVGRIHDLYTLTVITGLVN